MMPDAQADLSRIVDRRMALAREWDELVEQVRKVEGFEDLLKPPPLEKLLPAAANGPVAIINISQWRCDALIITTAGVQVEELSNVSAESVAEKTNYYLSVESDLSTSPDPDGRAPWPNPIGRSDRKCC